MPSLMKTTPRLSERNIWDGEKMVTEAQYTKDIMAAYHAQQKED